MKHPLEIPQSATSIALGLTLAALTIGPPAMAGDSISIDDIRFASQVGIPPAPRGMQGAVSVPPSPVEFRGTSRQTCASLDLNTFLHQFDPNELLAELRQSLLSGAQLQISNYLITLAYSAPTLASVLDMTDRQLAARFTAFTQVCANQQVRTAALENTERRLADASDQCFAREIARGTAPTGAYRRCSVARSFQDFELPATLSTVDFLRRHSDLVITPRIETLLELLPDERIAAGNYQMRPPRMSIGTISDALQARSRLALTQIIDGVAPTAIAECAFDSILDRLGPACLPRSASTVVDSPAFRGARLLGPAARSMFEEALSSQIAVTAVYSDLLDLTQQITRMNLRGTSDASVGEIVSRQRALQDHVTRVLLQADLQLRLQEFKLKSARTQLLALERAQSDLQAVSDALRIHQKPPVFSLNGMLQLFQDRN